MISGAMLEPWIIWMRDAMGELRWRFGYGRECRYRCPAPCGGRLSGRVSRRLDGVAHIQLRQYGSAENQRATVGNAGFDDEIGLDLPDQFLHGYHILGYWMMGRSSQVKL